MVSCCSQGAVSGTACDRNSAKPRLGALARLGRLLDDSALQVRIAKGENGVTDAVGAAGAAGGFLTG